MQGADGNVVVGYEANGGFLLGSDIVRNRITLSALPTRDAILPMLALLTLAKQRARPMSELASALPARFTASDRIQQVPTEVSRELIAALASDSQQAAALMAPDSGPVAAQDSTDGLRLTFGNGDVVHLRPSGNAPELRCYAEAGSNAAALDLCNACLQRIASKVRENQA
jgi:phosphomannomutase